MNAHLDKYETVAEIICGKQKGLAHEECYQSRKGGYPPCRGYGKCCLFEKSEQQLDFVLHPLETEVFLKACPGSGKTEVVGLMAAYAMRQRAWRHQGIAVLSFTNNAADVIRERVGRFAGKTGFPHYVGTFDSWLHGYLLNPYGYLFTGFAGKQGDRSIRVVAIDSDASFLRHYQTKYQYAQCGHATANQFFFDAESGKVVFDSGQESVDFPRRQLQLEKWQEDDLVNAKARFWKDGFATHQDIELICAELLEMSNEVPERLARRFPYIVVDECQDLSAGQLKMLESLRRNGSRVHLVGDLNQAIYSFRKVDPERVRQFIDTNKLGVLPLTRNFRSVQTIVDVCGQLRDQGVVEGLPVASKHAACVYFTYKGKNLENLPAAFEAFVNARGCELKSTAVLARGHSTLKKLSAFDPTLPNNLSKRFALAIHLWKQGDAKCLHDALKCAGSVVGSWFFPNEPHDSRNQARPEAVPSNVEWRLFLARVLDGCIQHSTIGNLHQTWKVWADCGRKGLGGILDCAWKGNASFPNHDIGLRVPQGEAGSNVYDSLELGNPAARCNLRITTFHQIKGETLDAALVVSSPTLKSDGGHWLQWLDKTGDEEHRRFAYVASSRPQRLLAWALPEPDELQKQVLAKLGFLPAS